ncbi:MAG TPA: hypothetical protein DCP92_24480 [Nitrospiraceae bacterium]|nr:hypothetical protein [Nitrospiraceae bacterium]
MLFLLVTSIFIIAFHHHDDDCDHDDCPICMAAHQTSAVIFNFGFFAVFYAFLNLVVFKKGSLFTSIPQSFLNSRAPPA